MKLQRYFLGSYRLDEQRCGEFLEEPMMRESDQGEWVRYSDVEKLIKEIQEQPKCQ